VVFGSSVRHQFRHCLSETEAIRGTRFAEKLPKLKVGEAMTINAREFLVFVAIVASALVLQVRQHSDERPAAAQSMHEGLCNPTKSAWRNGPLRASCKPANDVRGDVRGTSVQPKARIQPWV
jgi:hypothetical protein